MEKLTDLIRSLQAFTIIIIENAFMYETNPENILGKFCLLTEQNRNKILGSLKLHGHENLFSFLNDFYLNFNQANRNLETEVEMKAEVYFKRYLERIGANHLNTEDVIREIDAALHQDDQNELKDIFLRYGIYNIDEADYENLISVIRQVENAQIKIYKNHPPHDEVDKFFC